MTARAAVVPVAASTFGFGRIVVSETEVPNIFANLALRG
jgi:hypothetical protein